MSPIEHGEVFVLNDGGEVSILMKEHEYYKKNLKKKKKKKNSWFLHVRIILMMTKYYLYNDL